MERGKEVSKKGETTPDLFGTFPFSQTVGCEIGDSEQQKIYTGKKKKNAKCMKNIKERKQNAKL